MFVTGVFEAGTEHKADDILAKQPHPLESNV